MPENSFSKKFEGPPRTEKVKEDYGQELVKNAEDFSEKISSPEKEPISGPWLEVMSSDMEKLKKTKPEVYEYYSDIIKGFNPPVDKFFLEKRLRLMQEAGLPKESIEKIAQFEGFETLLKIERLDPPEAIRALLKKEMKINGGLGLGFLPEEIGDFLESKPTKKDYELLKRVNEIDPDHRISLSDQLFFIKSSHSNTLDKRIFNNLLNDKKFNILKDGLVRLRKINDITPESMGDIGKLTHRDTGSMRRILSERFNESVRNLKLKYGIEVGLVAGLADTADKFSAREIKEALSKTYHGRAEYLMDEYNFRFNSVEDVLCSGRSALVDRLIKNKVVFSKEVGNTRLFARTIFEEIERDWFVTLLGRERTSKLRDINHFATLGRRLRGPYRGAEYLAAVSGLEVEMIVGRDLKKGKETIGYIRKQLTDIPKLRERFERIFTTLHDWGKEGEKLENTLKYKNFYVGARARWDAGLNLRGPFDSRVGFSPNKYHDLHVNLDKSFKSPSSVSRRIGHGVEGLYKFMTENKEEFEKILPQMKIYFSRQQEYEGASEEKKFIEKKFKGILNPLEIMESIYKTQRGLYLDSPPLHGRAGGEDSPDWDLRSYFLRDRIFYKQKYKKGGGADYFINVKEYHIGQPKNDLRLQLYSFSDAPDVKKLGQLGFSVKVEKNGRMRFLTPDEIKSLTEQLETYTLPTLYLKKSPLFEVPDSKTRLS